MTEQVLHTLYLVITEPAPPSVNHLYRTGMHGKRVLTKEGAAFKAALQLAVVGECMTLPWKEAVDAVYNDVAWIRLSIGLYLPVFNRTWKPGKRTAKGDLSLPYKKLDATNYIKAIEDAIASGTGIDDCAHLTVSITKHHSEIPAVEVAYEVISQATYAI